MKFIMINDYVNIILNQVQYNLLKKTGECILYFIESSFQIKYDFKVLANTKSFLV